MAKITFADKVSTIISSLPIINRIRAEDVNEIKSVVNENADNMQEKLTAGNNIIIDDDNVISSEEIYSTTEKIIGTWIDGKPIYRVVFVIDISDYSSQDLWIAHNLTNMDSFWINQGESKLTNSSETIPPTFYYGSNSDWARLAINTRNIRFKYTNSSISSYILYAVIEYTKTTD